MKKILIVFGTRPEAIKMCPLIKEFSLNYENYETKVCVTGQHREMLDQVLSVFDIIPDFDLNIMRNNQDLYDVTSRVLIGMRDVLKEVKPDVVFIHGDTTTSMAVALAAFYQQIPIAHVEAGLRTYNKYSPWPEEINRQITSRVTNFHFAPTHQSKLNLTNEGIKNSDIIITGNTVIDALHFVVNKINSDVFLQKKIEMNIQNNSYDVNRLNSGKSLVLITGHRRENFGNGFLNICKAIKHLVNEYENVDFVYPMHLNPMVRKPINEIFGKEQFSNLFFIEPLEYLSFIFLMSKSKIIMTDSGGIQEEAPGLGKPVLVMRDTTERPEAVKAGTVKLVGTDSNKIINEVSLLLENEDYYNDMSRSINPYGDGLSSKRIVDYFNKL